VPGLKHALSGLGTSAAAGRRLGLAGYLLLSTVLVFASRWAFLRLGSDHFVIALGGVLFAALYSIISFRYLTIPFHIFVLSVCGFRFIWSIRTPILPDLYLDRMTMIWLIMVFAVKFVATRQAPRGPYKLDLLILAHGLFLFAQVAMQKFEMFHTWTICILIPYAAYFLAKNIVITDRQIRNMLWVLLALSVYYNITSVAEKYEINWLLWPRYMVGAKGEFRGRSQGPFLQAPLFGTVIGMMLPIHLYFLATVKRQSGRILLLVSLMLGLAGLYFTYTRGSWVTGIVALATAAALNRRAYLRFLLPAVVIAPIVAVGLLGLAQDKFARERLENESTIESRLGTAVTVFRVWRNHPVFGCGFFQYRNVRDQYIQPVEIPGMATIRFFQFRHTSIHDIYLGPLAENGLVGAALQGAIYLFIYRAFRRKFVLGVGSDHVTQLAFPIFAGMMVGYLVGGLAFDYRFFAVVGTLFMVCAGTIDGYRQGCIQGDALAPR